MAFEKIKSIIKKPEESKKHKLEQILKHEQFKDASVRLMYQYDAPEGTYKIMSFDEKFEYKFFSNEDENKNKNEAYGRYFFNNFAVAKLFARLANNKTFLYDKNDYQFANFEQFYNALQIIVYRALWECYKDEDPNIAYNDLRNIEEIMKTMNLMMNTIKHYQQILNYNNWII